MCKECRVRKNKIKTFGCNKCNFGSDIYKGFCCYDEDGTYTVDGDRMKKIEDLNSCPLGEI